MASVLIVVSSVNLWLLLPSLAFGLLVFICRRLFLPSGRNIRRVEGAVRNPKIGHMQATFNGLLTIRACGAQNVLQDEFEKHLDVYSSILYMRHATMQAFRFCLEILTVCYIAVVLSFLLLLKDNISASSVGFAITQAFTLTWSLQTFTYQSSEFEMYMTSAERLFEYFNAESEDKSGSLSVEMKNKSKIVYKNVSLRYSQNNHTVLKNISFDIEHGERVGIVGRTGSGKSSIIAILFRLYPFDGTISINGVDIQTLSINELRSKISIIPQNPTLFSGTIRSNLDPNGLYTDKELWRTLEQVEMNNKINSLDQVISQSGTSFTIGEKQLICIARVILQNNSVVVLDEATACVDARTENHIQEIIKNIFINKTIMTIAHRLHTVMDYDKIIVLDSGTVVECGSPSNLLRIGGIFYSMVKASKLLHHEDASSN